MYELKLELKKKSHNDSSGIVDSSFMARLIKSDIFASFFQIGNIINITIFQMRQI